MNPQLVFLITYAIGILYVFALLCAIFFEPKYLPYLVPLAPFVILIILSAPLWYAFLQ